MEYTARTPVYLVVPTPLAVAGALPPPILGSPTGRLSRWASGSTVKPERASPQVACSAVHSAWLAPCGGSTQRERVQLRRMALAHVPATARAHQTTAISHTIGAAVVVPPSLGPATVACSAGPSAWLVLCGRSTPQQPVQLSGMVLVHVLATA
jgi:hypothetical protein